MTETDILDGILQREGGWRDQKKRPNGTFDPPTNYGITLDTLRRWRQRDFPGSVVDENDLRKLTALQASGIYTAMFVTEPGFTTDNIPFEPLRVQMIDFGVNSGPERAIRWLQRVLRVEATGKIDQATRGHLRGSFNLPRNPLTMALLNDALVAARSYMIDQSVDQGIMRKEDEEGVESRALSFFLAKP